MVKTRMGLLDLRVQSATLNATLRGARVANVYDAHNGRTYILKLAVPPARDINPPTSHTAWQKRLLLIESGVRLHVTHFDRDKDLPTGFCLKLRKHVRTRRLDAVRQIAGDRIVDIVFSAAGEVAAHIIVECFSGGNVILTDGGLSILTVLRTFRPTTPGAAPIAPKEMYPVEKARELVAPRFDAFVSAVQAAAQQVPDDAALAAAPTRAARRKMAARADPKKALASVLCLEPALVEHALLRARAGTSLVELAADNTVMKAMFEALTEVEDTLTRQIESGDAVKGFIVSSAQPPPDEEEAKTKSQRYHEFSPYLFEQYKDRPWKEFATFDEAADEFFSRLESERAEASQAKREAAAYKRVDKLATELKGQVSILESARDLSWERAQAIEGNITEVENAITVIRSAVAAAVPWNRLAVIVEEEKKNGNPVAEIIHSLQLDRNEITLMLEDTFGVDDMQDDGEDEDNSDDEDNGDVYNDDDDDAHDDDSDADDGDANDEISPKGRRQRSRQSRFEPSSQTRKALLVSVDISLGAHANARRHYEMRKSAAAKMEKAVEATDRTLKAASKRAASEASKIEAEAVAASIRARRKALWFEKFYWFVSSENYLVVAGKDAQQNELLVNRYLGPADVYVHADLSGASSVIVKNHKQLGATSYGEIPRMTLEQAGTFAMCRSSAWDAKVVTSAWWVRASQVSKTAASGSYLPPGTFMIRGKKNFLDPTQLVMGIAFIFKVDESCISAHQGERDVRGFVDAEEFADGSLHVLTGSESAHDSTSAPQKQATEQPLEQPSQPANNNDMSVREDSSRDFQQEEPPVSPDSEVPEQTPNRPSLEDSTGDTDSPPGNTEQELSKKTPRAKKKHMSAKERRAMKNRKGSSRDTTESVNQTEDQEIEDSRTGDSQAKEKKGKGSAPLPRGKKHKLKKMKKYVDQDEEERNIALAILGSKPIKEEIAAEEDKDGEEESIEEVDGVEPGTGEQNGNRREYKSERREVMRLTEEEGIAELENLERESMRTLDMLTGLPSAADVVEYALPMCAPYGALTGYRYKVKLMPGSTKRGKAYRSAVALFLKQAERDLSQFKQERDAVRLSPESAGIHSMLGSVKIMAPGLAEAQKSLQKPKKQSKKGSKRK